VDEHLARAKFLLPRFFLEKESPICYFEAITQHVQRPKELVRGSRSDFHCRNRVVFIGSSAANFGNDTAPTCAFELFYLERNSHVTFNEEAPLYDEPNTISCGRSLIRVEPSLIESASGRRKLPDKLETFLLSLIFQSPKPSCRVFYPSFYAKPLRRLKEVRAGNLGPSSRC